MRDKKAPYTCLSAKAANGVGLAIPVSGFGNIGIEIYTANNANLTIKAQGTMKEVAPDFSAAASATNVWSYIQMIDYINDGNINGNTGIVFSGTDGVKHLKMNIDELSFVNFEVSGRTAGNITVLVYACDNV